MPDLDTGDLAALINACGTDQRRRFRRTVWAGSLIRAALMRCGLPTLPI